LVKFSEIRESKYLFLIIIILKVLQSCTNLRELSFFLIKKTSISIKDFKSLIQPMWKFLAINVFNLVCSAKDKEYILDILDFAPRTSLIMWFHLWWSRIVSKSFFINTDLNCWTCGEIAEILFLIWLQKKY